MRSLSVNSHIKLLTVCPNCQDVYPSANSKHMQDTCTACNSVLFLPDLTKRGNRRAIKTPVIKYPYLSLSDQLSSLLRLPGVKALLDEWCQTPQNLGDYSNIFDRKVCWLDLKASNGSLFFSNLPHQKNGPEGELRIRVNLGVDWYVYLISQHNLLNMAIGFHTYAATLPLPTHHVLCLSWSATSHPNISMPHHHVHIPHAWFCRYHMSNLLCTSILPGPKEQNLDEIQRFLCPIVSDLLRLWKHGIVVPTESKPEGESLNRMWYKMCWITQVVWCVWSLSLLYATNWQRIKSEALHLIRTLTFAPSVG
jgi:hypothetical protein